MYTRSGVYLIFLNRFAIMREVDPGWIRARHDTWKKYTGTYIRRAHAHDTYTRDTTFGGDTATATMVKMGYYMVSNRY